jgi:diacylglycerol kinase family enzyme
MRTLLVANPKATATSPRTRDVLARALGSDLKVDLVETERRAHAIELGRRARAEAYELVVVLGGDGTVNEVVNGVLADGVHADQPALAVVPGGSTNVFSRALGISRNPVEATADLLAAIREGRSRRIGLGVAGERWFTFTAGLGLDADAIRRVERARAAGRQATPARYARAAFGRFLHSDRRHAAIRLERPGHPPVEGLHLGIVSNTAPWTFIGSRPVVLVRDTSFDAGLDLAALTRMGLLGTLWAASGLLTSRGLRGRSALVLTDLDEFRLVADRPLHFQVDGDYLGERDEVRFRGVPGALRVIC